VEWKIPPSAGLATPDYQQRCTTTALVLRLTDYLGKILAARSGLMTTTNFRAPSRSPPRCLITATALVASLADTTVAPNCLRFAGGRQPPAQHGFYPEGDLSGLKRTPHPAAKRR